MSDEEKLDDLLLHWEALAEEGQETTAEELCRDCPELVEALRRRITALKAMGWMTRAVEQSEAQILQPGVEQPDRPRLLAGRYRLDSLLGEGGMGQVWKGYDLELQRPVAVKVPKPSRRFSPDEIERFLAEARHVAALRHSGIVAVHDVVQAEGAYVIVADLIDGYDLGKRLGQGRLGPAEAARIVAEVARSLDHAHHQGMVHRDIKPSNLLLDAQGKAFVCDFGIAVEQTPTAAPADRAGTLPYCSPEQVQEQPLDARSDIWSLGVVLYQALTGRLPFEADDPAALREEIINQAPRTPRTINRAVPRALERVCLKCLAKRPEDRYPAAGALADDLEKYLRRPARRHWVVLAASLLVALIAIGAFYLGGAFNRDKAIPTPEQPVTGEPPVTQAHAQAVRCVQFAPDGRLLASGGADAKVRIWKLGGGLEEVAVLDQLAPVRSLTFSSSGKTLVVGCDNGTTRFWDVSVAKPKEGLVVPGHSGPVTCLALSSDEKILVTGGADGTTRVRLVTGDQTPAAVIPKATETTISVTLNPAADKLLVGLGNGSKPAELYLWHIVPEKKRPRLNNGGRAVLRTVDDVRAITASPDHAIILAATPRKITVWSQMRVVGTFEKHNATITCVALVPDKLHAVSADEDGNVIFWNVKELREVQRQKGAGVQSVAVSPDGSQVAIGGVDGSVRLWQPTRPSP